MMCGFMQRAMLKFETKLQQYIRMGITIFKIFTWGGVHVWSDIRLEITFYVSAHASPLNLISDHISDDIPPQMKILNKLSSKYFLTHQF